MLELRFIDALQPETGIADRRIKTSAEYSLHHVFLTHLVIGMIVMGGFVQILVSFISIDIGRVLAKIIEIPIYILLLISKIDFGNFKVITPELYQVILYYLISCLLRYLYIIFHSKNCTMTQERLKNIILIWMSLFLKVKRIIMFQV